MVSNTKVQQAIILNTSEDSRANKNAQKKLEREWRRNQKRLKKEQEKRNR